jgi:prophage regulatory protein
MAEQSSRIKMLRIEQVAEKVGYKKSTIYDWMNENSPRHKPYFPQPRKNGRSNRWFESEIDSFCTLEFGGNSKAAVEGGCPVHSEASNIPSAPQGKAIKAIGKGALPSSNPEMIPGNLLECPESVEHNPAPPQSQIAQLIDEKIAGTVLGEQQIVATQQLTVIDLKATTEDANMPVDEMSIKPDGDPVISSSQKTPRETRKEVSTIMMTDAKGREQMIKVETRKKRRGTLVST